MIRRATTTTISFLNVASPRLDADPVASLLVLPPERVSRKSMKSFEVSFVDHQIQQPKNKLYE
jgi:hypothetical protein